MDYDKRPPFEQRSHHLDKSSFLCKKSPTIDFCTIIYFCESYYYTNWLTAIYRNPLFMILHHPCFGDSTRTLPPEISSPSFGFSMRNMATSNKMGSHPVLGKAGQQGFVKVLWWVTGLACFWPKWLNLLPMNEKNISQISSCPVSGWDV